MSEVETVALWVGIIVGIAGIVLSLVAIAFAVLVNNRAGQVGDQTIQSLMKIETTVLRLSEDTTGLIKGAWDKLLGQVGQRPSPEDQKAAEEVASGLSAEIGARLTPDSRNHPLEVDTKLDALLDDIRATITGQLLAKPDEKPADAIERLLGVLGAMSPEARQLARSIGAAHLTLAQYNAIRHSTLGDALRELRSANILLPLVHAESENDNGEPVYWFPPGQPRAIVAALHLLPDPPRDVREKVVEQLRTVGYYREDDEEGEHEEDTSN